VILLKTVSKRVVAVAQVLPDPLQEQVVKVGQVLPLSFGSSSNDMGCY